ncbi:hypothetical protein [uncultured Desulfobacter sp.]|uniref:hypothetical protein n=1 Tax=uncultured Desulfobacter sp. TaxID=240139 RepID=UPI0029F4BC1A|nr:hypothetical protein [uncultured Desulfobacter sp.]
MLEKFGKAAFDLLEKLNKTSFDPYLKDAAYNVLNAFTYNLDVIHSLRFATDWVANANRRL